LEATAAELAMADFDRNLLWSIRSYSGPRIKEEKSLALSADFLEWVITTFRSHWPMTDRGYGPSEGDQNDFDASDYIVHMIRRLGSNFTDPDVSALRRIVSALKIAIPNWQKPLWQINQRAAWSLHMFPQHWLN
jgi:hypothetical protein